MNRKEKIAKQYKIERKCGYSPIVAYENALIWLEIEELELCVFNW